MEKEKQAAAQEGNGNFYPFHYALLTASFLALTAALAGAVSKVHNSTENYIARYYSALEKYDQNQDGVLSYEERIAFHHYIAQRFGLHYDEQRMIDFIDNRGNSFSVPILRTQKEGLLDQADLAALLEEAQK